MHEDLFIMNKGIKSSWQKSRDFHIKQWLPTQPFTSALSIFMVIKGLPFISLSFSLYSELLYMRELISPMNFHYVHANGQMMIERLGLNCEEVHSCSVWFPAFGRLFKETPCPCRKPVCKAAQGWCHNVEGLKSHPTKENMIGEWTQKKAADLYSFPPRT